MSFSTGSELPSSGIFPSEIVQVGTDGSQRVRRLAPHRSVCCDYWDSPRANISGDGRLVVYTGNFGGRARRDVFILRVPPTAERWRSWSATPPCGVWQLSAPFSVRPKAHPRWRGEIRNGQGDYPHGRQDPRGAGRSGPTKHARVMLPGAVTLAHAPACAQIVQDLIGGPSKAH